MSKIIYNIGTLYPDHLKSQITVYSKNNRYCIHNIVFDNNASNLLGINIGDKVSFLKDSVTGKFSIETTLENGFPLECFLELYFKSKEITEMLISSETDREDVEYIIYDIEKEGEEFVLTNSKIEYLKSEEVKPSPSIWERILKIFK